MKKLMTAAVILILILGPVIPMSVPSPVVAATIYTVNATDDTDDGTCDGVHCSLREAINAANVNPGSDTISFAISGTGPFTIQPNSALPTITDPVVIDGYTQPGASPNTLAVGNDAVLMIELDGTNAGSSVDGLTVTSGSSTIRGLVINRFSGDGIQLDTLGGNVIEGNFIGTDVSGATDQGNSANGIYIVSGDGNLVGGGSPVARNVISGNNSNGVRIDGGVGAEVKGNYIGVSAPGTTDLGNTQDGVYLYGATTGNVIGGMGTGDGNVISGNNSDGIGIGGVDGNTIQGNIIGLNATGVAKIGNSANGIYLVNSTEDTVIGGTSTASRNIISGNSSDGIELNYVVVADNGIRIMGNYIGTDVTGTERLGNNTGIYLNRSCYIEIGGDEAGAGNLISGNSNGISIAGDGYFVADHNLVTGNLIGTDVTGSVSLYNSTGIRVGVNTRYNVIGGTSAAERNVISGNYTGVWISAGEDTLVQGNYIGTDITGSAPLGNTNYGVSITQNYTSVSNTIGGTEADMANVIAYNGVGIAMTDNPPYGAPLRNAILGNSIHSNTGLGIDLGNDGVTVNDPGDGDTGENNLQNFPVLTGIGVCSGSTTIAGTLDSTPSTEYRVEFFTSSGSDTSGYGEGETYLGYTSVTTGSGGTASFSATLPAAVSAGQYVAATATDPNNNTSEFGAAGQPLIVVTGSATLVSSGSATLNGELADMGISGSVAVSFEYGISPGSYTETAVAVESPLSDTGSFHADIGGLSEGQTYYYRVVASGSGTSCGGEDQFTVMVPNVEIHVNLQGTGRPEPEGWEIPINVGFYPPGSDNETLLNPGSAIYYYSRTGSYTVTMSGTRSVVLVGPVNSGTYDVTVDSDTTLLNVKRGVWIP